VRVYQFHHFGMNYVDINDTSNHGRFSSSWIA